MSRKSTIAILIVAGIGVALVALGGGLIPFFHHKIHDQIVETVQLKEGSESLKTWRDPPAPVYMQFWVFDLVNPLEVTSSGAIPVVKQKGPYTYKEIQTKENLTFLENGTLLSYVKPKSFVFQRNLSAGSENDTFTSVNLPILTFAVMFEKFIKDWKSPAKEAANTAVSAALNALGEKLFETHTVKEYIWGYEEPSIKKLKDILKKLGIKLPIDAIVGLFTGPTGNGTDDGTYRIFTGKGDIDKLNTIDTWKGNSTLPYWGDRYCNMINGSDGSGWHPYVTKDETLYIFSSDICRSIYVEFEKDQQLEGIDLYRFTAPRMVFANHTTNPDNLGYCTPDEEHCLGDGVLNVSSCKGAPIVVSQPHFYLGAEKYIKAIDGMHPHSKDHQMFVDVEPLTGAALHVSKKLQINAYIEELPCFSDTKTFKAGTIFPILWLNESAKVTDDGITKFKKEVYGPIRMTEGIQFGLIALGVLLLICALLVAIVLAVKRNKSDHSLLVNSEDPDESTTS